MRLFVQLLVRLADDGAGAQALLHRLGARDQLGERVAGGARALDVGARDVAAVAVAGGAGVEEERLAPRAPRLLAIVTWCSVAAFSPSATMFLYGVSGSSCRVAARNSEVQLELRARRRRRTRRATAACPTRRDAVGLVDGRRSRTASCARAADRAPASATAGSASPMPHVVARRVSSPTKATLARRMQVRARVGGVLDHDDVELRPANSRCRARAGFSQKFVRLRSTPASAAGPDAPAARSRAAPAAANAGTPASAAAARTDRRTRCATSACPSG